VKLTAFARCHRCGLLPVTPAGDPGAADKAAAKHWRATGHPVATVTEAAT
jgi:hypothetical protein